ncbi:sulfotransferase 1 family member D1-like [Mizuhopecten yessoensis]|uniref:Sulfotransferase family cytosolic 1B member 1 n=1 Tax=Mizuhopecten yessoensis TaxID=6573 RepID=A0A210PFB3_MIZYE|nr:sulfotransferase 1 family member D1-like [Mizuhopecten yessoensis]OWF35183.1 Sulfotransferase family cytosolic 1B member 1 [Mizuhopecten yessoensis]
MPSKKLPDNAGTSVTVMDLDGYYLPTFNELKNHEEELRSIPDWQARDDDLMICTYPKSGTHWIWEIVSMLVKKKAERVSAVKETAMLEIMAKATLDNMPSPRVLNSHVYFEYLPKDFAKRRCKIIYAMRNPKDVAVSFFNHHSKICEYEFSGTWENYVQRFLKGDVDYGTWFDYTQKWEKFMADNPEYPIFMTTYEDMKQDPLRQVTRIAKFLEIDCDQAFLQEVTDLCQFDRMKKEKDALGEQVDAWKDGVPGMYRKGQVGDWKNWFTVAQSELFDRVYQERMKDSKVQPRFTLS